MRLDLADIRRPTVSACTRGRARRGASDAKPHAKVANDPGFSHSRSLNQAVTILAASARMQSAGTKTPPLCPGRCHRIDAQAGRRDHRRD